MKTYLVINKEWVFNMLFALAILVAGAVGCAIEKKIGSYLIGVFMIFLGAGLAVLLSYMLPAAHRFSESGVEFCYLTGSLTVRWEDVERISVSPSAINMMRIGYLLSGPEVRPKNRFTGAFIPKNRKTKSLLESFYKGRIG